VPRGRTPRNPLEVLLLPTKPLLLPYPRKLEVEKGTYKLPSEGWIRLQEDVAAQLLPAATCLQDELLALSGTILHTCVEKPKGPHPVVLRIRVGPTRGLRPDGYELSIAKDGIEVTAYDAAGAFYAAQALVQLVRQYGTKLPRMAIEDYPDYERRGVMLDVSRDKVPRMETLRRLIPLLASWRINEFQLYTEHTIAYAGHAAVWAEASPFTPDEIRELDALCWRHHVDLVPNQNSFGHMERWLRHKDYARFAERPEDPFSLEPGEESLELLGDLYDQLLPPFSSQYLNVGCDETFDLGQGKSKALCEEQGVGRVYLDFLLQIHELVEERGHTMLYWGDIIMAHPELISELPRDAIALEWGYEADHPFDADAQRFSDAGVPFYVCPGTSTWCSIAGRTDNMVGNLENAAENGLRHGAKGYLITAWGDSGHRDPLPMSYPGFAYGAALSWCAKSNRFDRALDALSLHVFGDSTGKAARAIADLGNVYKAMSTPRVNGSPLWDAYWRDPPPERRDGLIAEHVADALCQIREAVARFERAEVSAPDAELLRLEMRYVGRMLEHGCLRLAGGAGVAVPPGAPGTPAELRAHLSELLDDFRSVWLARNRPGGMLDSERRLREILDGYAHAEGK